MRRRCHDLHAVDRRETQRVAPVPDTRGQRTVRVPHRFRHARGARAEHQHGIGVARMLYRGGGGVRRGGDRFVEVVHGHQVGQQRVVPHGMVGTRHVQRVADIGGLPGGGADQHRRRAQAPDGLHGEDELGPVGRHDGDALACAHATAFEGAGQSGGQRIDLRSCVDAVLEGKHSHVAHRAVRSHMVSDNPIDRSTNENILSPVENYILIWVE